MEWQKHGSERVYNSSKSDEDLKSMISELRNQNFDVIRFAAYRAACKLRYIQKRTNMHLIDIWNVIEAFRENCFNTLESKSEVTVIKLESLIASMFSQLNKRLPSSQQINVETSASLFLKWFASALDPENSGRIQVFAIKICLAVISSGKAVDKLRYIFSQISDNNGQMVYSRFIDFLREVLTLPASIFEAPSFSFDESLASSIFDGNTKITVNDFLDTLMSDPSPQCLMWLSILHRMANVENVLHPVQCDGCHRASFMGFRYKCQRCYNYQLCQDCFWRGRTSGSHTNEHQMKEYTTYKSTGKQIGRSLRKSFRCIPDKAENTIPKFPDQPEKPLNLSHIVPPSPMPTHNGYHPFSQSFDISSIDSSPSRMNTLEASKVDDEHILIARYAAKLAANTVYPGRSPSELSLDIDNSKAQRELIAQLELKNRQILKEIGKIKQQQEAELKTEQNPILVAELKSLRNRKQELESHLSNLQESRRELMLQLESLMKLLKNHQNSPKSTPNSSPHSLTSSKSPPVLSSNQNQTSFLSAPTTPGSNLSSLAHSAEIPCSDDDGCNSLGRMQLQDPKGFDTEDTESDLDTSNTLWREDFKRRLVQENQFLAEIRARRKNSSEINPTNSTMISSPEKSEEPAVTVSSEPQNGSEITDGKAASQNEEDDEEEIREFYNNTYYHHSAGGGGVTTDDESYVRTDDDDDGGGTDWEDSMRRWINR